MYKTGPSKGASTNPSYKSTSINKYWLFLQSLVAKFWTTVSRNNCAGLVLQDSFFTRLAKLQHLVLDRFLVRSHPHYVLQSMEWKISSILGQVQNVQKCRHNGDKTQPQQTHLHIQQHVQNTSWLRTFPELLWLSQLHNWIELPPTKSLFPVQQWQSNIVAAWYTEEPVVGLTTNILFLSVVASCLDEWCISNLRLYGGLDMAK